MTTTPQELRDMVVKMRQACADMRRKQFPIAELIPMLQRAADALEGATAVHDALEEARTGLLWYRDNVPGAWNGCDEEAMARIDAALGPS